MTTDMRSGDRVTSRTALNERFATSYMQVSRACLAALFALAVIVPLTDTASAARTGHLTLSRSHLMVGENVVLHAGNTSRSGRVTWGDGSTGRLAPHSVIRHRYQRAGRFTIRIKLGKLVQRRQAFVRWPTGARIWAINEHAGQPPMVPARPVPRETIGFGFDPTWGTWLLAANGDASLVNTQFSWLSNPFPEKIAGPPQFQTSVTDVTQLEQSQYGPITFGLTLFLKRDGTVWAEGEGEQGQLGDGTQGEGRIATAPVRVGDLAGITKIANGGQTGYALRADGTVWAWGSADTGALGNGSTSNSPVPTQVQGLDHVVDIAATPAITGYAVKSDGTVWVWGCGASGLHGNGTAQDVSFFTPRQVPGLAGIASIDADIDNSTVFAINAAGQVWAWGMNEFALPNAGGAKVPWNATGTGSKEKVVTSPVAVPQLRNVAEASAGLAIRRDGRVFQWLAGKPRIAPAPNNALAVERGQVLAQNTLTGLR